MSKPDKLPTLDPNVRGIFDRILATVEQVRKERRSHEYLQQQEREMKAEVMRRTVKELQAKVEQAQLAQEVRCASGDLSNAHRPFII